MPLRKTSNTETNTKYIEDIARVVKNYTLHYVTISNLGNKEEPQDHTDLSLFKYSNIKPYSQELLVELSTQIYLKEHRLRYQAEQNQRLSASFKKFNSKLYTWRNRTVEDFVLDYNAFLWSQINKSHLYLSPKIEANYRGNYYDSNKGSAIDSTIFYLYFRRSKVQRFISRVLNSAYRNPVSLKTHSQLP